MTQPDNTARPEVLLWHDAFHEGLEAEHLHFFRLSFSPSYDRTRIYARLASFYEELSITSRVAYETLGEYDLLLRLWIPTRFNVEDVELRLWGALRDLDVWGINYLSCHTHLHWASPDVAFDTVDDLPPVSEDVVHEVNHFNECQWPGRSPQPRSPEVDQLIEQGALIPVGLDTRGIRFFVRFNHPQDAFNVTTRRSALNMIRTKCVEVADRWRGRPDVTEPHISIYEGAGTMTDFLVMARAPHPAFHNFVRELVLGLRESQLTELFGMRPFTHVLADRMFSDFAECRLVPPEEDADLVLDREESETLEFKATFAIDFRSLMAIGRREPDDDRVHAVARAVCGMLNSPYGGTIVIGVLEVRREVDRLRDPAPYLAKLSSEFGYEVPAEPDLKVEELPNAVIGVEVEIGAQGPFADEDKYLNRLTEALRTIIDPNPLPFLRLSLRDAPNGRRVCVVRTRLADHWFYVKSQDRRHAEFVVREAVSSRAYVGAEIDLYRQAHPRTGRRSDG